MLFINFILIRGKLQIITHSKVRKRYNNCLKDGLSEEYAQEFRTQGFFQLNSYLCYSNTTILLVDLKEHNIMYKISVKDKVQQRYFFIPIYNVAQTDRCSCLKQVAMTTERTQLEIFLVQRLLCIRLYTTYYYSVVSDTFLQVNLCTLQNIIEKHV